MSETKTNNALEVILRRTSIRDFTGASVDKNILDTILRAGMAAPSAKNIQPWNFICIIDRKILNQLAGGLPYARMLYKSAAAVIVCGTPDKEDKELNDYWVQDCSAATENILLAVEALGLGAVWTGVHPRSIRIQTVKEILGIPDEVIPLNVIAIGVPAQRTLPKDKYNPQKIHWEKW